MQHEVTSRPGATSPAQPPAGVAAPDRPSGGRLLLEGLAVYLVLQAADGRVPARRALDPGDLLRRCAVGVLRAGEAWAGRVAARRVPADLHRPRRGGGPAHRPGRDLHVGLLPDRPGDGVGRGRAGRVGVWVWVGELAAHHLVEPAPGDRLDAAGPGLGPSGPGAGSAALCGRLWGRGWAAVAGRPSRGVGVHLVRPGHLWAGLEPGRRGAGLAAAGPDRGVAPGWGAGGVGGVVRLAAAADAGVAAPGVADDSGF